MNSVTFQTEKNDSRLDFVIQPSGGEIGGKWEVLCNHKPVTSLTVKQYALMPQSFPISVEGVPFVLVHHAGKWDIASDGKYLLHKTELETSAKDYVSVVGFILTALTLLQPVLFGLNAFSATVTAVGILALLRASYAPFYKGNRMKHHLTCFGYAFLFWAIQIVWFIFGR